MQTIIEIRRHREGWEAFEALGVEPYFGEKREALDYAMERMRSRTGQIHVFDAAGNAENVIPFTRDRPPRPLV